MDFHILPFMISFCKKLKKCFFFFFFENAFVFRYHEKSARRMSSIQFSSFYSWCQKSPNWRWLELIQVNRLTLTQVFRVRKLVGYLAVEKLDIQFNLERYKAWETTTALRPIRQAGASSALHLFHSPGFTFFIHNSRWQLWCLVLSSSSILPLTNVEPMPLSWWIIKFGWLSKP